MVMEFFIRKNATLPVLEINLFKDGRLDYNYQNTIELRVRYGETDQMGYLYYGNYAQYYEIGRVEMLRSLGITYKNIEEDPDTTKHRVYFLFTILDSRKEDIEGDATQYAVVGRVDLISRRLFGLIHVFEFMGEATGVTG
jgi:hypothetical protein